MSEEEIRDLLKTVVVIDHDEKPEQDPYLDEGTGILRNKRGITSHGMLKRAEAYSATAGLKRALSHLSSISVVDLGAWLEAHRILFSDLYEWAGTIRTTNLSHEVAGAYFNAPPEILAGECEKALNAARLDPAFAENMGAHYAELNFQHPFREGNGRALKCVFSEVARRHGIVLDWEKIDRTAYVDGLKGWSVTTNPSAIQAVLESCASSIDSIITDWVAAMQSGLTASAVFGSVKIND